MSVEREIAVFAFPFAAGVIAAITLGASPCIINPTYPTMALTATTLSAALLLHPQRREWKISSQWSLVILCALTCGMFIGLSGLELTISATQSSGLLDQWAMDLGNRVKSHIDAIAFKNRSTNEIMNALLTGERSGLTAEIKTAFRDSGASHILALSGLHLGIIYAIISKILSVTGNKKGMQRVRSLLIMAACGLYTLATGAGASITRAYVFIVIKEAAVMAGRHASLKSLLAAALIFHLAFDPAAASDVGFQLSYAAIFGIAYIYPHLRNIWRNDWRGLKWIWESAALSISCQLTTGPLAYCYFGTFPQYFLLTNLIAVPLAGMIIPAALLTTVLYTAGCCPAIILRITEFLIQAMYEALRTIASM